MLRLEVEGRGCVVIHRRVLLLHHCVALCVCVERDLCYACNSGGSRSNRIKKKGFYPQKRRIYPVFRKEGRGVIVEEEYLLL